MIYWKVIYFDYHCQNYRKWLSPEQSDKFEKKIYKSSRSRLTLSRQRKIESFHVVVWQRKAKKYTKNYDGSAQLLFWPPLNFLFSFVPVPIAVVVS